ncbi:MAG: energy transducer TonB [Bacteroidales bacterium]
MTKKIKIFCLISMLFFSNSIFGTGQFWDCLIYKSDTLELINIPLKQYLDTSQIKDCKMFNKMEYLNMISMKEYASTWKIENDSLYLLSIKIKYTDSTKDTFKLDYVDLNEILVGRYLNGKILADWFSGSLYSPIGKCVFSADEGLVTSYEKELELKIQNGIMIGENFLDNSKSRHNVYDTPPFFNGNYFNSLINWAIIPKIFDGDIRVVVRYSANEDGIIDDVRVLRPRGDVFDSEAIRVVKMLPGDVRIFHGQLSRQYWIIPVIFSESRRIK